MRCSSCGYSLLNLGTRVCPECSTAFKPSDFEFKPNAVRFCCPHCDQSYYGNDERGHLTPRSFVCVSCQRPVDMDEMVLRSAEGFDENSTETDAVPWEEHKWTPKGFFRTAGWALIAPHRMGRALLHPRSKGTGFVFGFLVQITGAVLATIPMILIVSLFSAAASGARATKGVGGPPAGFVALGMGSISLAWIAVWGVSSLLWILSSHALTLLTGCERRSLRLTAATVFYSSGCGLLGWVPCLGQYTAGIGWIWQIISAGIISAKVNPTTPRRAAACMVIPPVVVAAGIIGAAIWLLGFAMTAANQARRGAVTSMNSAMQQVEAVRVAGALARYRGDAGDWPLHPLALADGSYLIPSDLMLDSNRIQDDSVAIGNRQLSAFSTLSQEDQTALVKFARATADSDGTTADTLGDYVFVYRGLGADPAAERWVFIQVDRFSQFAPRSIVVGQADGTTRVVDFATWGIALAAENAIRGQIGAPPIADPFSGKLPTPAVPPPFPGTNPGIDPTPPEPAPPTAVEPENTPDPGGG
ncbi:MAG: hypothetical protein ACOYN0_04990 [Phycisphaerales bacterium]